MLLHSSSIQPLPNIILEGFGKPQAFPPPHQKTCNWQIWKKICIVSCTRVRIIWLWINYKILDTWQFLQAHPWVPRNFSPNVNYIMHVGRMGENKGKCVVKALKASQKHLTLQLGSGKDQTRGAVIRTAFKPEIKKCLPYSVVLVIQVVNFRESTLPIFLQILCLPPYFNWDFLKVV